LLVSPYRVGIASGVAARSRYTRNIFVVRLGRLQALIVKGRSRQKCDEGDHNTEVKRCLYVGM
jgi:hypothetical protein